jgi:hypothetical protein
LITNILFCRLINTQIHFENPPLNPEDRRRARNGPDLPLSILAVSAYISLSRNQTIYRSEKQMKLRLTALAAAVLLTVAAFSQNTTPEQPEPLQPRYRCGTQAPSPEWDRWFNAKVEQYKAAKAIGKAKPMSLTIPVVVHVIHGNQGVGVFPNLSNAQIASQIKVFNDDFAGNGFNVQNLAATGFSAVGAVDTKITFCLAQFDPDGVAMTEPGITRHNYITEGWTSPATPGSFTNFQSLMDGTIKPATIWDPTYYFNIWVTDVNPTVYLLGYATLPAGSGLTGIPGGTGNSLTDGIWVWAKCFGTTGTLDPVFNKGRTATHETGHWLGLRHIGGDATNSAGDCNATDYCNDTPPQKGGYASGTNGQNYGAPTYPLHVNVCGSAFGDMFMNFMDYTEDRICYMFTPDQNDRMQTAMQNSAFRSQLSASSMTQCVGLPVVELNDGGKICTGTDQNVILASAGDGSTSYTWTADPATGVTFNPNNNSANPTLVVNTSGMYTITVVASNGVGLTTNWGTVEAEQCDGISEKTISKGNLALLPNPAVDKLNIRYSFKGKVTIFLFNALGEKVAQEESEDANAGAFVLQIGGYAEGVYLVTVQQGAATQHGKLVIAR